MAKAFSLDDFDNAPQPPKCLYKYLSAGRVGNVLEGGTVRFTPLLNTNDSFEVRSTFYKLAGPRFLRLLAEKMDVAVSEANVDAIIAEKLQNVGLGCFSSEVAKQIIEQQHGGNFTAILRRQMQMTVDTMLTPYVNDPKFAEELLNKLGRELLCFSLSESCGSPPMWAHYADNHAGFIVAFDTKHDWFQLGNNGKRTRLQKVAYFDDKVEEPLENVQAAFISKTTDWAYEREWRVYVREDQVDKAVGDSDDPMHLLNFPSDAVECVIVGAKATEETLTQIRVALAAKYSGVSLYRAVPDRSTQTYQLEPT